MTDIERYEEQGTVELVDSPLVLWAQEASAAHRIAQSLVKTSFVPAAMRGKAEEATAAILTGQEVGLKPMAALRSINIIQGTPAMTAVAMRALVQSQGHEVWVVEQTDTKAVVKGRRRGSDQEQKSTWTMDRARGLGLATKDNWKKQPQAMLVARATSEVCRLIAADVLLGLPYSVEELADHDETAPDTPAPRRRARRQLEPVATPEPELDEPTPEPAPEPDEQVVVVNEPEIEWPEPAQPGGAA